MHSCVLSVRVNATERDLLEVATEQAHTNLSDFVRRKAIEAAEVDIMERRIVAIPADDWENFEDWVNAPAEEIPALKELANTPTMCRR